MAFWKKYYKSRYTGEQIDAGIKGGAQVPDVTSADNGKILKVSGGKWAKGTDSGTTVKANPTLAGTEAALTGLQVESTKYKVEQPINVVANPTLAGTEDALEGLQVGSTKYKVAAGGGFVCNFTGTLNMGTGQIQITACDQTFNDIIAAVIAGPVIANCIISANDSPVIYLSNMSVRLFNMPGSESISCAGFGYDNADVLTVYTIQMLADDDFSVSMFDLDSQA